MSESESIPPIASSETLPDYQVDLVRLAHRASAQAKFLFAVAVAELSHDHRGEDQQRLPKGPGIVVLGAWSPPVIWFERIFGKRLGIDYLQELGSIQLQYIDMNGLVIRPVFTRIESRCTYRLCSHDFVLQFDPAIAQWLIQPENNTALEEIIGWPDRLLDDFLKAVWTKPGDMARTLPIFTDDRHCYATGKRPEVCPFCGRDSICSIEFGFFSDRILGNAISHHLVGVGGCLTNLGHDPQWMCSECGINLRAVL